MCSCNCKWLPKAGGFCFFVMFVALIIIGVVFVIGLTGSTTVNRTPGIVILCVSSVPLAGCVLVFWFFYCRGRRLMPQWLFNFILSVVVFVFAGACIGMVVGGAVILSLRQPDSGSSMTTSGACLIAFGCVSLVIAIAAPVFFCHRRKKQMREERVEGDAAPSVSLILKVPL